MNAEQIRAVENAAFRAWPPAESVEREGWTLRYGDGFSRRLNSLSAGPKASAAGLEDRLEHARSWMGARGVTEVVRITSAAPPDIDGALADLGYVREAPTIVMTGPVGDTGGDSVINDRPTAAWLAAQQQWMAIPADDVPRWRTVLGRIPQPAAFPVRHRQGATVCVGIGVVVDDRLGIFEVTTDPAHRRQGHATAVVRRLLDWGRARGAETAFLQVMASNQPALRLYEALGFVEAYRYWYRRREA